MISDPVLFPANVGLPAAPPAEPVHVQLHAEVVSIPMHGGRCLRLAAMDGALLLVVGFTDDAPLRSLTHALAIPLELWLGVRRALDELAKGA
jgi:hypothetical protein